MPCGWGRSPPPQPRVEASLSHRPRETVTAARRARVPATYGGVDGSYGGPPPDASGNSSGQDDSPSLLAYGAPPNPADADVTLDDDGDDGPPPR